MSGQSRELLVSYFRQAVEALNTELATKYPNDGVYVETSSGLVFIPWEKFRTTKLRAIYYSPGAKDFIGDKLRNGQLPNEPSEEPKPILIVPPDQYTLLGISLSGEVYRNEPAKRRIRRIKI